MIRDSFINCISSLLILQKLLDNKTLGIQTAFVQASALYLAQRASEAYTLSVSQPRAFTAAIVSLDNVIKAYLNFLIKTGPQTQKSPLLLLHTLPSCFFCGGILHKRSPYQALGAAYN